MPYLFNLRFAGISFVVCLCTLLSGPGCTNPEKQTAEDPHPEDISENIQSPTGTTTYLDPTGTYHLDRDTTMRGEDFYGTLGRVQVKMVSGDTLVLTLGIVNGAPGYHSGYLVDTLRYDDSSAIYKAPAFIDQDCRIVFQFSDEGITVVQSPIGSVGGCGFGQGVVADGFYRKTDTAEPVLQHYITGEILDGQ